MSASNSPQGEEWGFVAKAFVVLGCLTFIVSFITSAWSTHNFLFILGAIGTAFIGLLQIDFIHGWFTDHVIPSLNSLDPHAGKVINSTKQGALKVWELRNILLVFIILGSVIKDSSPLPSLVQNGLYNFLCIQHQAPCGNGISVTSLPVNESKDNQNIVSSINIGIIDNASAGPFNQYDAHNYNVERTLEKDIFTENQSYPGKPYVTLMVATALSQTVTDTSLSSNIGLDELRGAYMAQYNLNHDPSQQYKLRLLIANFGTKGAALQTVPIVMNQIKLYANSDPQHFIGVIGFSFSASAIPALDSRSRIPGDNIPIISSASADKLSDLSNTPPPDNFYTNFYRIISPVSEESQVLADFVQNHLAPTPIPTLLFEDRNESYSQALGSRAYNDLGASNTAYYTEGEPDTLDLGIHDIIQNHYSQIFFSGFADDLNALKDKLNIAKMNGELTWDIRIIGGEGLYDLGSYTNGNYANLVFTINASYAQISQDISLHGIQVPDNKDCPSQDVAPFTFHFNDEFCHLFNQDNSPSLYGYKLAGTHVLQMYDAVEAFLQALPQGGKTTSSPLWQTINQNLPTVQFQGVTGKIQFSQSGNNTVNNPINKPFYVACTDNNGYTHAVGEYEINGSSFSYKPVGDELHACTGESHIAAQVNNYIPIASNATSAGQTQNKVNSVNNAHRAQTQSQNDSDFWLYFILILGTILIMAILPFFTGYMGQKMYYRGEEPRENLPDEEEYLDKLLDETRKHYTFAKGQVIFSLTVGIIFLVASFAILAPIAYHLSILTNASLLLGTAGALMSAIATYSLALNVRGIKMINKHERKINNIHVVKYSMAKAVNELSGEERKKEILRLIEILIEKE